MLRGRHFHNAVLKNISPLASADLPDNQTRTAPQLCVVVKAVAVCYVAARGFNTNLCLCTVYQL